MGKSKLAPYPMHTVPCLELCAAALAVELAEVIQSEIDIVLQAVRFFHRQSYCAKLYPQQFMEVLYLCS